MRDCRYVQINQINKDLKNQMNDLKILLLKPLAIIFLFFK